MPGVSPNLAEKSGVKIVEKVSCNYWGSGYNKSNVDRGAVHVRGAAPESTNHDSRLGRRQFL